MNIILDAGHGGMAFGRYLTAGKRSPEVPPGIFEGEFNREMCALIDHRLYANGIGSLLLNPGPINIALTQRIKTVNQIFKIEKDITLISIHANAENNGQWGDARGFKIFYKPNCASSKRLALFIESSVSQGGIKTRKSASTNNLYIMRSKCPTILVECGFMTNKEEAKKLADPEYNRALAGFITEGISNYEKGNA